MRLKITDDATDRLREQTRTDSRATDTDDDESPRQTLRELTISHTYQSRQVNEESTMVEFSTGPST